MTESPTLTIGATQPGVIVGTAAYMAPEQARARTVDKRADIWAFGVVLFEMLTGRRLFQGEDVSETLAAIIKEEPDWSLVPAQVRRLLKSCLARDPRRRLRDIGDVARALFKLPPGSTPPDVTYDGKRFLARVPTDQDAQTPFTVITNWQSALKR